MNTAAPWDARLVLHPGHAASITGHRADAARVLVGRSAAELPALAGSLFTLCAHAHRLAARLAVAAAQAGAGPTLEPTAAERRAHRLATARDQMLRMAHDWPQQLGHATQAEQALAALRASPLWQAGLPEEAQAVQLQAWLQVHWLGQPVAHWLASHRAASDEHAAHWAAHGPGPVAALLREVLPLARRTAALGSSWLPLGHPAPTGHASPASHAMRELAARLAAGAPLFDTLPFPDTGPWSRQAAAGHASPVTAWSRLVARLEDLLHLAGPDGDHWLVAGALHVEPGVGLAWIEMARGLLVHRVRLEGRGGAAHVAEFQVLAPTDLNFHPQGVLARALRALPSHGAADAARLLAVAFDPCVAFDIEAPDA